MEEQGIVIDTRKEQVILDEGENKGEMPIQKGQNGFETREERMRMVGQWLDKEQGEVEKSSKETSLTIRLGKTKKTVRRGLWKVWKERE